jgi:hypothetical protein
MKYVLNSIISSLNVDDLEEEDKEEIMSRFEPSEDLEGMDMEAEDDFGSEETSAEPVEPAPASPEGEMEENVEFNDRFSRLSNRYSDMSDTDKHFRSKIMDSIFTESKVDKVLSKYFVVSDIEKEVQENKKKIKEEFYNNRKKGILNEIKKYSLTKKQLRISEEFIETLPMITFVGRTNKGNLVFEHKNNQVKISPEGRIL